MKALLIAVGSHGDVHPVVGLGCALKARGHRVILATNSHFESLATRAGLEFAPLGTEQEFKHVLENPDLWHPTKAFPLVMRQAALPLLRRTYEWVEREYVAGETVVAAASLAFGARIAQEKLGLSLATIHLQPAVFRSCYQHPKFPGVFMPDWYPVAFKQLFFWLGDRVFVDRVLGPVNEFRRELGLSPVRRLMQHWWHSPQRVLALFPDWFAAPQPDWPPQTLCTGFPLYDEKELRPLDPQLAQFLDAGSPPVVFTPGSAMKHAHDFFEQSAIACQRIGCRGLFLARHADQIPKQLPDTIRHFEYAPFSQVLPRTAAFVHHGGIGTCAQGLAAGVPQLVMPLAHDQPDNAARLERLGVGAAIGVKKYRAETVAAALKTLTTSTEIQRRCREVAQRFHHNNALTVACEALEALVTQPAVLP